MDRARLAQVVVRLVDRLGIVLHTVRLGFKATLEGVGHLDLMRGIPVDSAPVGRVDRLMVMVMVMVMAVLVIAHMLVAI